MSELTSKCTVLITGCSAGGLGYGLAEAFHARGLRVFATARNPMKMADLKDRGIETLTLDVLDDKSIENCVEQVRTMTGGSLDILVNNAGGVGMPIADINITEAKKLFDLNVWSYIAMTQAFLPLLIKARGMIVNQTSTSSVELQPHNSVYNASKAAVASFSEHMRLELAAFGIRVVDLKTGGVTTNFDSNHQGGKATLPADSIYNLVREETEKQMRDPWDQGSKLDEWSKTVVNDLLKANPRFVIWRGLGVSMAWFFSTFVPVGWWDRSWRRLTGLELLEKRLRERGGLV